MSFPILLPRGPDLHSDRAYQPLSAKAAAKIGATYQPVTTTQAYDAMLQGGLDESVASMGAEYATVYADGWGDYATTDFTDVTGREPRTFADFARDNL